MNRDSVAIAVHQVSKCYRVYGSQRERIASALWPSRRTRSGDVWALRDVSFEVRRGEALAVIGRNGSGKSTLLEIIAGTVTPTAGAVEVRGKVAALLELGSGFNPEYTGRENVILNGLLLGLSRDEMLARFDQIAAFADLGDVLDRPVKTYSSGMVMRLAFSVQVVLEPEILIVDEALSVGDFFFQQKCATRIRQLREQGVTLIFVSHDMGLVRNVCRQAVFLKTGMLQYCGNVVEACRMYFASDRIAGAGLPTAGKPAGIHDAGLERSEEQNKVQAYLREAIWSPPPGESAEAGQAAILGVCILDAREAQCETFRIGDIVKVRVIYRVTGAEPIHVSLRLTDRLGRLITNVGSPTKGVAPPVAPAGSIVVCDLDLGLDVEAGNYGLKVHLSVDGAEPRGRTHVCESPVLGPITVNWDYERDIPPHFGMVGLPCNVSFRNI